MGFEKGAAVSWLNLAKSNGTKRARRVQARRALTIYFRTVGIAALLLFGSLFGLLQASICTGGKFILKLLNASRRVDKLQLACIERMASATNVYFQLRANTASLKRITATTSDGGLLVFGMNVCFHNRLNWEVSVGASVGRKQKSR